MVKDFVQPPASIPSSAQLIFCSTTKDFYFINHENFTNYVWNAENGTTHSQQLYSLVFAEDNDGNIWHNNTLNKIDANTKQSENVLKSIKASGQDIPERIVFLDIVVDHHNKVWLSTDFIGLWMYDPEKKTIKQYKHSASDPYSIASDVLYDLHVTSENKIAVGSIHGLSVLDQSTDQFQNYSESDGLGHNEIKAITEDNNGNLWVSTVAGLSSVNMDDSRIRNYNNDDGLPNNNFMTYASHTDQKGNLYFGMYGGSIRFHPDNLSKTQFTGPLHLLDFYIKKELIQPQDSSELLSNNIRFLKELKLNHKQGDIGFSFTMPAYDNNDKIVYKYQLDGYDEHWTSTQDQFAHYTNIQPGKYTFNVKVEESDRFSASEVSSLDIIISPPIWKTWWAYVLYLLGISALIYFIYNFNLSRHLARAEAQQLKEMDELKTRFFTNITHEFRTPLTVIMGINENIKGHPTEKSLIRRNGKNLLLLVNQLLDLSKAEFGNLKVNDTWGDIINFLQYLTESFSSRATDKNIRLTYYAEEEELMTLFDENKVQQIIYNLISNALKFTEGEGKIIVHVLKEAYHDKPVITIKIKDTGIGIPEHLIPHIFDRFYQADNSSTRRGEGSGIGLALVKELVEILDGDITVESAEGKGTQFTIKLPIRKAKHKSTPTFQKLDKEQAEARLPEFAVPVLENETATYDSKRQSDKDDSKPIILLVEDNRDVRTYIESILKDEYQIQIADNGALGIEKAIQVVPDIIISDVMMPIKDGYAVCDTLKRDVRTSHIPIILLTAKATQEDKIEGLQYGADAYLTKPFDKDELRIRLQKLVEANQKRQAYYASTHLDTSQSIGTDEPSLIKSKTEDDFIARLTTIVEQHVSDNQFGVPELNKAIGMSKTQGYRKLKALTDKAPSQFIRSIRLQKALQLLQNSELNISEIAYEVGFSDPNYFSRTFQEEFGKSPRHYRN